MALEVILRRKPSSLWETFLGSPLPTLARLLHTQRTFTRVPSNAASTSQLAIVCISDIHNTQPFLPEGDLLLVAGDLTEHGTIDELSCQLDWLNEQPHQHKIVVAGNHDICLDPRKSALLNMPHLHRNDWRWDTVAYLEDSSTVLSFSNGRTLKVHGSPWTRRYGNWAFQYEKGHGEHHFSRKVDIDTDILITHCPPSCYLDMSDGEDALLEELWRVRPKLHCFGHMHGGYGRETVVYDRFQCLYERVCRGQAGLSTVLLMATILLWNLIFPATRRTRSTTLVNAAVVGGRSNEERRRVQVVYL